MYRQKVDTVDVRIRLVFPDLVTYVTESWKMVPNHTFFKPGACQPAACVRLVSYNHFNSAKVCVCVYAPEAINN